MYVSVGYKSGLMSEQFVLERGRDAPIAEAVYLGAGAGAAMVGMRPIIEIEIAPFIYVAMDQLVSIISKSTYIYGGQTSSPITIRLPMLDNLFISAEHSGRPRSTLAALPGSQLG